MELVILSDPSVEMTPTSHDVQAWAIALLLRRNGSSLRWRISVWLPAALACVGMVYAWRAWLVAQTFPPMPRDAGVTGSYCALCNTLNGYATFGELLAGATLLTLLGGVVYLLGKVD